MFTVNYANKFFRMYSITTDKYGIDPLKDRIIARLPEIRAYTIHDVLQSERGAPDLISYVEYGSEDYWWHIMAYNGICLFSDIVEGTSLRIPDLGAIIQITNDTVKSSQESANIVTI